MDDYQLSIGSTSQEFHLQIVLVDLGGQILAKVDTQKINHHGILSLIQDLAFLIALELSLPGLPVPSLFFPVPYHPTSPLV